MTAEVAIINPLGIALAADSAVTIQQGFGQKVINSNLKLFSLSKFAPVAIMLYGNNNFLMETPWEIIFKLFRSDLKDKKYSTLEEYAVNFFNFIKNHIDFFTNEKQLNWYQNQLYTSFNAIRNNYNNQIAYNFMASETEKLSILNNNLDSIVQAHNQQQPTIDENIDREALEVSIKNIAADISAQIFPEFIHHLSISQKLQEIAKLILTNNFNSLGETGIVIAGYGEGEIYPSIITHEISGMFSNNLIYKRIFNKSVINDNSVISPIAGIIPFAQEDIVMSFIKGIHDNVFNQTSSLMQGTLQQLITNPNIQVSPNINSQDLVNSLMFQLNENMNHYIQHEMMNPMINFVRFLPKDELALMAETLINITAFKQKMGSHMETVGGAIDVAIITKGDGLIWVKRKKYFDSSMNQHFFANYFKG
ncbi:MAG: hypothetical protein H9855_03185 [Candidatus Acinetobacter avistercoris]|nr:hypothetical protein [Candidatus Acinetobacter avistercoris]